MKRADRKLAYSVVVVLAVIAAELAWFLFVGPANRNPYYATQCESNCDVPFWASPEFWTAAFTATLTGSTILLWWVTRNTWIHAQESSERQLRAYVSVKVHSAGYFRNKIFEADIRLVNTGQTPAYKLDNWTAVGIHEFPLVEPLRPAPERRPHSVSIGPALDKSITIRRETPLSDAEIEAMKRGQSAIYVWGRATYKDAFGVNRWINFRMYTFSTEGTTQGLLNYPDGNDAN